VQILLEGRPDRLVGQQAGGRYHGSFGNE
jgi:hypothetical protein